MFNYFYPNRPMLVPPDPKDPLSPKRDYIDGLEASGKYVAELKWNGDNALDYTDDTTLWNRHHQHLAYRPSPEMADELHRFPKGCIVNGELVNRLTKTVKHLFIVHCVMAWKGKLLMGKSWGDSRKILEDYNGYGEHVKLSEIHTKGFWELFQSAAGSTVIEGIVLKNPTGILKFSSTPLADVSWMLKIRHPSARVGSF